MNQSLMFLQSLKIIIDIITIKIEYFCKQVGKQIAIYIDYVEEVKHKQRS